MKAPGLGRWLLAAVLIMGCRAPEGATLIRGGQVVDGTGTPARRADVRIVGDRIVAVGDLTPYRGEPVIEASGRILAPGFIDTHSHHDEGLQARPRALAAVSQGITTIVVGHDGGSSFPLARLFESLEAHPPAINVGSFVGHGAIRAVVMGENYRRPARPREGERMAELLREELDAGALGLSTGLEYDPGQHASTEELIALARVVAAAGGRYHSHLRSEERGIWEAVDEIVRIGSEARVPVQISHAMLATRSLWGQAPRLRARLDAARRQGVEVTADVSPYTSWPSTLTGLIAGSDAADRETVARALEERLPPDGIVLTRFEPNPDYVGHSVADIADQRGTDPVTTYLALLEESRQWREREGGPPESVIGTILEEQDVNRLIAWPHTNICSDGVLRGAHPRGFGAFPRVLGRLVRETELLTLEEAIHKMSGLAADHVGIRDRGRIRVGAHADLVLLDPETVLDRSTVDEPHRPARGIEKVWVNGIVVYEDGETTGERPGRVVRRETLEEAP